MTPCPLSSLRRNALRLAPGPSPLRKILHSGGGVSSSVVELVWSETVPSSPPHTPTKCWMSAWEPEPTTQRFSKFSNCRWMQVLSFFCFCRYLAIVRSFESHLNTHRTLLLGLLVWMAALLNGALPIINGSGYGFSLITHTCTVSWHLISFELTCMLQTIRFFVPLTVLIYSYGRIILVAREARNQVSPAPASAGNHRPEKRTNVTDDTSLVVELASESRTSMGSSASNVPSQPCDTDAASNERAIGKNELSARSDNQRRKAPSTSGYVVATKPALDVHKLNASQWPGDSSSVGQESFRTSYNMISALSGLTQQPTCNPSLLFERKMNILRRRKASNTLFILVGVFFVCWAPYVFLTFRIQGKQDWRGNVSTTLVLLALANSSINVFLYGLTNTKYRREIQSFLKNCVSLNRLKTRFNVQVDQVQVATISKSIAKVRKESQTKYISHGEIPLASDPHNRRAAAKKSNSRREAS